MRFSIPTRIGLTLLANLVMLAALSAALLLQQSRGGLQSLLLSPSQDRIRGIGSAVAEAYPPQSAAGRAALFARYEREYNLQMFLYDRMGNMVQGAERETPGPV